MKKIIMCIILGIMILICISFCLRTYYKSNNIIKINPTKNEYCDYIPKLYYEEKDRKIYSYCLDKIEIKLGNNFIELKDYFNNHTINDFENFFTGGISYDDGGTIIYKDGGTKKYLKGDTTVLICRTVEGNRDIYIGNKHMNYERNFCK